MFKRAFCVFLSCLAAAPAFAQPAAPSLTFPVACKPGKDCWTVNYVDTLATDEARDFTCAAKTFDGHKGTDFALRSMAEMRAGVDVFAAAAGTVARVRDGENDTVKSDMELDAISAAQKECGNGVLIDHAAGGFPGWQTMYCHLRQGSITIKSGEVIVPGQKIAQIGRSGLAEFPHLHFGVIQGENIIDPYTGAGAHEGCGKDGTPLWKEDVPYEPLSLYDSGFGAGLPDFNSIENGAQPPQTIAANSGSLVLWAAFYGLQKDDMIDIRIAAPNGETIAQRAITQETVRPRQYYYTGRQMAAGQRLAPGTYTGRITLRRTGLPDVTRTQTVRVE